MRTYTAGRTYAVARGSRRQIQYHATFNAALVQTREYVVDILQLVGGDSRPHLALGDEVQ